jgi:hypothetical protein
MQATSSARPPAPWVGQTIYETNTNRLLVWNGSAWVIPNSPAQNPTGLEFIKSQSLSGTETQVTNCFSATYSSYRVVFSNLKFSAIDLMTLRMVTGTTPNTTSNYYHSRLEIRNGDGVITGAGINGSSYFLPGIAGFTTSSGGTVDIYNPYDDTAATAYNSTGIDTRTDGAAARFGGGFFNGTTRFDGLWISNLAGSRTMTGTVRIYGYRDS